MNVISPEDIDAYLHDHAPGVIYGVRVVDERGEAFFRNMLYKILLNRPENLEVVTELPADAPQWLQKKWPEGGPYYRFTPNQALDEQMDHIAEWIAGAITDREAWIDRCDINGQPFKLMQINSLGDAMKAANESMRARNARLAKQYENVFANEKIIAKFDEGGGIHLPDEEGYAELEAPFTMVELRTADELNLESANMGHCIGRDWYQAKLANGNCEFFSLRDKLNKPKATFEVAKESNRLLQCRGAQNQPPVAKYRPMVQAFVRKKKIRILGMDIDTGLIGGPAGEYPQGYNEYLDIYHLPKNYRHEGTLDFTYTFEDKIKTLPITYLPEGLHVTGSLILKNTPLTKLPKNLTVGKVLDLNSSAVEELPENLNVGGSVDVRNTAITVIPDDSSIGGTVVGLQLIPPAIPAARPVAPVPVRPADVGDPRARVEEIRALLAERRARSLERMREQLAEAKPGGFVEKLMQQRISDAQAEIAGAGMGRMR